MSERGHSVHSFNLAAVGMHAFETDFGLMVALASEPARLRLVFHELLYSDPSEFIGGTPLPTV